MRSVWPYGLLTIFVAMALVLGGCGGGDETATAVPVAPTEAPTATAVQATATTATEPTAAPQQAESPLSPLAAPESPLAPAAILPEMNPEMTEADGAVTGRVVVVRPSGESVPVTNVIMGLAEVIRDESGVPKVAGYEPSAAPRADVDEAGQFVLSRVPPGTYALILDAVITQAMLTDPATGDTILIDVKPNEVIELGQLEYDSLPLPGLGLNADN